MHLIKLLLQSGKPFLGAVIHTVSIPQVWVWPDSECRCQHVTASPVVLLRGEWYGSQRPLSLQHHQRWEDQQPVQLRWGTTLSPLHQIVTVTSHSDRKLSLCLHLDFYDWYRETINGNLIDLSNWLNLQLMYRIRFSTMVYTVQNQEMAGKIASCTCNSAY